MSLTLLIPIYNASTSLKHLLKSIPTAVPQGTPIVLADDASTESGIGSICADFVALWGSEARYVRHEQNLGFVGNVNHCMAEHVQGDVVLLNSDTALAAGFLRAIQTCAASDPHIATATPWSNNAEICSFPNMCEKNPMPDMTLLRQTMQAAQKVTPIYPELPTGVGFCMYIRRRAWDMLGGFDAETFGKGYGEENDFCMRAKGFGWKNVLCDNAYVAHLGHASFSETGHEPGGANMDALVKRYPTYQAQVAQFIMDDPLATQRGRVANALSVIRSISTH